MPDDIESAKRLYKELGMDEPHIMEFIPHESIIKKLIERAT